MEGGIEQKAKVATGSRAGKAGVREPCQRTERNIYRILQNAASKSAGGAPEAARTGTVESVALTSTEKDASMSAETFNVTNEIICEQSVMMSLNNGTATESVSRLRALISSFLSDFIFFVPYFSPIKDASFSEMSRSWIRAFALY